MSAKVAGLILAPLVVGATMIYGATHQDKTSALLGSTEGIFQVIRDNARAYAGFLDETEQAELVYIRGFARSLLDILYVNPDDVPHEDRINILELTFKKGGTSPLEDIKAALGPIANGVLAVGEPTDEEEPLLLMLGDDEVPDGYTRVDIEMSGGKELQILENEIDASDSESETNGVINTSVTPKLLLCIRSEDIQYTKQLTDYFQKDYFDANEQAAELAALKGNRPMLQRVEDYNAMNIFKTPDPSKSVSPLSVRQSGGNEVSITMHVIKPYIPLYVIKLSRIALYQYMAIHRPFGSWSWRWLFMDVAITLAMHAVLVSLDLMPFDLEAVLTDASFGMIVISCLTIIMNVVQPDGSDSNHEETVAKKIDTIVSHISPYVLLVPIPVWGMRDA